MKRVVKVAEKAGFCFGVSRAVRLTEEGLSEGKKIVTLGPIIHNSAVVNDLRDRGVRIIEKAEEAEKGETVVIRSHGITRAEQEILDAKGVEYIDENAIIISNSSSDMSVSIPSTVTHIGKHGITSGVSSTDLTISVASANTVYDSRDNCNAIIEKATNRLILGSKSSTIPSTVNVLRFSLYPITCFTISTVIGTSLIEEYALIVLKAPSNSRIFLL